MKAQTLSGQCSLFLTVLKYFRGIFMLIFLKFLPFLITDLRKGSNIGHLYFSVILNQHFQLNPLYIYF